MPREWHHRVPVPGFAHLAQPPFPDIDQFDSLEVITNRVQKGMLPESALVEGAGISRQQRNYFWYATAFRPPARKQVAILRVNKAQFGTAVWLNGKKIDEHAGCFSAAYFNVTSAVNAGAENRLVVRIGAHPGVLPADFPAGTDFEKNLWTPGIYDDVVLLLGDNPIIESVQVAPHLQDSRIDVQTRLKNYGEAPAQFILNERVRAWNGGREVGRAKPLRMVLASGEEKTCMQTVALPGAELWTPEHPFLYQLETSTGGDSTSTRFGMRELRFDTPTRRAYLNGKLYFLRGSNITLHRFFEDPLSGVLPWTEGWVLKLLVDIPKRMNWNSFRFCIGPVSGQVAGYRRRSRPSDSERVFCLDRGAGLVQALSPNLESARDDPAVRRMDARQLEPSQRSHMGCQQRNPGCRFRRKSHPRSTRAGSFQSPLGKQLQRSAGAGRSGRRSSVSFPERQRKG